MRIAKTIIFRNDSFFISLRRYSEGINIWRSGPLFLQKSGSFVSVQ